MRNIRMAHGGLLLAVSIVSVLPGCERKPQQTRPPTTGVLADRFDFTQPITIHCLHDGLWYRLTPGTDAYVTLQTALEDCTYTIMDFATDSEMKDLRRKLPGVVSHRFTQGHTVACEIWVGRSCLKLPDGSDAAKYAKPDEVPVLDGLRESLEAAGATPEMQHQ
jgi:hypothetical protein